MSYKPVFNPNETGVNIGVVESLVKTLQDIKFLIEGMGTRIPNEENRRKLNDVAFALQKVVKQCEASLIIKNDITNRPKGP